MWLPYIIIWDQPPLLQHCSTPNSKFQEQNLPIRLYIYTHSFLAVNQDIRKTLKSYLFTVEAMDTGEPEDLGSGSGEEEEGAQVSGAIDPTILDYEDEEDEEKEDEEMREEGIGEKEDKEREEARIAERQRRIEADRAAKKMWQEAAAAAL